MLFNMLKGRNFRNFFLSDIIQGFGVGMSTIGANWYVLDSTGSAAAVGFILALNLLAGFLCFPLVGTLTDRFSRKQIIFSAHVIRAILIFIITLLFLIDGFSMIYLYLFTIINGVGWTIYMSASRSLTQEILTKDELVNGNSLIEISLQVGMFSAGAVSGILYKFYGFEFILLMNAFAFLLSSIFLIRVIYRTKIKVREKEETFIQSFKGGIGYLKRKPKLFLFGIVSVIPLTTTMVFNVILPGYVQDLLQADSTVFGTADMFYGIGGLLSGFLAASIVKKLTKPYTIVMFFSLATVVMLSLSFQHHVIWLFLGSMLIGLSNSSIRIHMNVLLMELVSERYMGRSMSVWMGVSLLLQSVLAYSIGHAIDRTHAGVGFTLMGGMMLIGIVLFIVVHHSMSKSNAKDVVVS
ncbi:MFS transporter [Oceanobacillus profundus]|uniref:MFS transporter n=1 Tax=Oceanobacillus TaxID=182709 RepID=UPI0026E1568A|nr:MFS transporter [Oceanobacillus profundus]MDO6448508.1 MFS transporter [Oceanobacillus profundus]